MYWELVEDDTEVIISNAFGRLQLFEFCGEISAVDELR